MFLDEAHLAARVRHPHVVPTLDVVALDGELFLVMEYIDGASLARLTSLVRQRGGRLEPKIVSAIVTNMLHGLHAAHETSNERGEPLDIVHRDVSPQNVLVGRDGLARVLDFGVAKATGRLQTTREGSLKGKLAYMAPEQIRRGPLTCRTDVYGASVVLWETLTCQRLFVGDNEGSVLEQVLLGLVDPPSKHNHEISEELDALTLKGLERDPAKRFETAREMALALERIAPPALSSEVGAWVRSVAEADLTARAQVLSGIERAPDYAGGLDGGVPVEPEATATDEVVANADLSSISVSANSSSLSARRGRAAWLAGGVLAVLVGGALLAHRIPATSGSTRIATALEPSGSNDPAPSMAAAGPSAPSAAEGPSATSPIASDSASPSATARPPPPRPRASTSAPASNRKKTGCTPPYTFDAAGKMLFKRECL